VADIFTEVEEDLRRERAKNLWTRYGRYFVAAAVIVILAAGAHTWWRSYERSQQLETAERYQAALSEGAVDAAPAEAAGRLEGLAQNAPGGYRLAALMRAAGLYGQAGDHAAAAQIYEAIAADSDVERLYRDLAEVLAIAQAARLAGRDPEDLLARIARHEEAGAPWRFSALEIAAGLALQAGDAAGARERLSAIADSADAPRQSRSRAAEILSAVGE